MFVKVKNSEVIKYPYDMSDLLNDNPHTNYDDRYDLLGWFILTDSHVKNQEELVEVELVPQPENTDETKKFVNLGPVLENGIWKERWDLIDKTLEELEDHSLKVTTRTTA
jgi:hypothetical protein